MTSPPPTVLASAVRMIESKQTGRQYRISISLPYAYSKSPNEGPPFDDTPAKWPVVYLLDANWNFGIVTDIVRLMALCGSGSITDAIIIMPSGRSACSSPFF
jgi:predicted alpha/beta superfamily hydrolase